MNRLLTELKALANAEQRAVLMRFFKTGPGQYGAGDDFLGVKVPQVRALVKRWADVLTPQEVDELVTSRHHEARLAGLLVLCRRYQLWRKDPAAQQALVDFYLARTAYINNWDLVDLSCYELLGRWLLDKERTLLYELAEDGRSLWENRIAIVTTLQFIRHGQFDDTLALAEKLLHHPHDLLHKAVGWMLREVGKRDQKRLEDFLKPRYHTMPRTMLRYAIERFDEPLRLAYLLAEV